MGTSNSKPAYIAIFGVPDSGLKELMDLYKQKQDMDNLKIDQKSADMRIWFKYKCIDFVYISCQ